MFFFQNIESTLRAKSDAYPLFAGWLESDIQGNSLLIKTIKIKGSKILSGKLGRWQTTGNLFTIQLDSEHVIVEYYEDEYLDDIASSKNEMKLAEFLILLDKWHEFIMSKEGESMRINTI